MVGCPFDAELQVKRKVETKGMSWWFADTPEAGDVGDTFLCFGVSEEGTDFNVEPHFHPMSSEYFTILGGKAHFELDGKEYVVSEGENFVIPRGVVHRVWSPEGESMKFKVKGDHDIVAERDFLMHMFTLVETNQFGLLKKYACWYQSGNFVPQLGWIFPKTVGRVFVWFLGGVLGTFLGLGKADLKKD